MNFWTLQGYDGIPLVLECLQVRIGCFVLSCLLEICYHYLQRNPVLHQADVIYTQTKDIAIGEVLRET